MTPEVSFRSSAAVENVTFIPSSDVAFNKSSVELRIAAKSDALTR